ncbi:hypothetical protein MLD38_007300 [Melastoma candidum]|uniref:Uncharacterized protein n=1 Tax=Melastoma candidum TaxID=119954 RepID=A0ACB9RZ74_9MYRT|nr:hypothetical protein MLD38_007300 [Melastoma candidum]
MSTHYSYNNNNHSNAISVLSFRHHFHHPLPRPSVTPPHHRYRLFPGVWASKDKDKGIHPDNNTLRPPLCISSRNAISEPLTQGKGKIDPFMEYAVIHHGLPVINWLEDDEGDVEEDDDRHSGLRHKQHRNATLQKVIPVHEIEVRVDAVRLMFETMKDGEISVSGYDTAWVALVEDREGKGRPQFPAAIEWISRNQLEDGSWGEATMFSAHDRIINTLACIVALKTWKIHPDKCERGLKFLKENLSKLADESAEQMPIGFEVTFPSLLEIAQGLEIDIGYDSPAVQEIYARREIKLSRIPRDIMHQVPTTLLHSLEGMNGLDWEKLMKLQCNNGSFLFSPSSTAFALIQTDDPGCFNYLSNVVRRFNGGVPNVYPVDLFEHMWVVDRLQRLGVSRYFKAEIEECMNYVARYWTKKGICWARNSPVSDIDDTSMGFRLLRLHGHDVSTEVFEQFNRGDEFFSFIGQSMEAVTGMYNLYRASQLRFHGETILEHANKYSANFLTVKRESNNLLDKWIVTKDLPGEVSYALDIPWYASLPRVETRFYIDQYGGEGDIWIGKTLYRFSFLSLPWKFVSCLVSVLVQLIWFFARRMKNVNNDLFLELARTDYKNCQLLHQSEWDSIQRWYSEWKLEDVGVTRKSLLRSFFIATASIFEPERSRERIAWTKSSVLVDAISSCFNVSGSLAERSSFVHEFTRRIQKQPYINGRNGSITNRVSKALAEAAAGILDQLSLEMLVGTGRDITVPLHVSWEKWLKSWEEGGETNKGLVELLVQTINLCSNSSDLSMSEGTWSRPLYRHLCNLTSNICLQLDRHRKQNVRMNGHHGRSGIATDPELEKSMQELTETVFRGTTGNVNREERMTFFVVTRGFYYSAHCDESTIDQHAAKVLSDSVL